MAETRYLTMTRQQMLDIRAKADHRDQPGARYHGKPIVGYSEWKAKDSLSDGDWRAGLVLADGEHVEPVEAKERPGGCPPHVPGRPARDERPSKTRRIARRRGIAA